jgi:hypothetical protein
MRESCSRQKTLTHPALPNLDSVCLQMIHRGPIAQDKRCIACGSITTSVLDIGATQDVRALDSQAKFMPVLRYISFLPLSSVTT